MNIESIKNAVDKKCRPIYVEDQPSNVVSDVPVLICVYVGEIACQTLSKEMGELFPASLSLSPVVSNVMIERADDLYKKDGTVVFDQKLESAYKQIREFGVSSPNGIGEIELCIMSVMHDSFYTDLDVSQALDSISETIELMRKRDVQFHNISFYGVLSKDHIIRSHEDSKYKNAFAFIAGGAKKEHCWKNIYHVEQAYQVGRYDNVCRSIVMKSLLDALNFKVGSFKDEEAHKTETVDLDYHWTSLGLYEQKIPEQILCLSIIGSLQRQKDLSDSQMESKLFEDAIKDTLRRSIKQVLDDVYQRKCLDDNGFTQDVLAKIPQYIPLRADGIKANSELVSDSESAIASPVPRLSLLDRLKKTARTPKKSDIQEKSLPFPGLLLNETYVEDFVSGLMMKCEDSVTNLYSSNGQIEVLKTIFSSLTKMARDVSVMDGIIRKELLAYKERRLSDESPDAYAESSNTLQGFLNIEFQKALQMYKTKILGGFIDELCKDLTDRLCVVISDSIKYTEQFQQLLSTLISSLYGGMNGTFENEIVDTELPLFCTAEKACEFIDFEKFKAEVTHFTDKHMSDQIAPFIENAKERSSVDLKIANVTQGASETSTWCAFLSHKNVEIEKGEVDVLADARFRKNALQLLAGRKWDSYRGLTNYYNGPQLNIEGGHDDD